MEGSARTFGSDARDQSVGPSLPHGDRVIQPLANANPADVIAVGVVLGPLDIHTGRTVFCADVFSCRVVVGNPLAAFIEVFRLDFSG